MPETKKVKVDNDDMFFTKIEGTNAWFESTQDGKPILNSGEAEMAKEAAKLAPKGYEVQVTIGPYRAYDIAGSINCKAKIIHIDLYSARPGSLKQLAEIMADGKKRAEQFEKTNKPIQKTNPESTVSTRVKNLVDNINP